MRAKDLAVDFINFIFLLFLISAAIIFFINKDNFDAVLTVIKYSAPISFFIILFLIKSKLDQRELRDRRGRGNMDILLNLTFYDKIALDLILFSSPIIILLISSLTGKPNLTDLLQAAAVFLIFYFWQKHFFGKASPSNNF